MREVGKKLHPGVPIAWIADSLPGLSSFRDRTSSFDLILVSAVWMHLAKKEREPAARRLAELLAPAGVIIVTLRHGPQDEERGIADIPDDELSDMMGRQGLTLIRKLFERDLRGRSEIAWSTLVYRKASLDRPPLEAMIADIK
jgi:hypothetical protein